MCRNVRIHMLNVEQDSPPKRKGELSSSGSVLKDLPRVDYHQPQGSRAAPQHEDRPRLSSSQQTACGGSCINGECVLRVYFKSTSSILQVHMQDTRRVIVYLEYTISILQAHLYYMQSVLDVSVYYINVIPFDPIDLSSLRIFVEVVACLKR